jgi:F0F1-type ATP synthase delta subunit
MVGIDETRLSRRYARAWSTIFSHQITAAVIEKITVAVTYLIEHPRIQFMLQLSVIEDDVKYQALQALGTHYELPSGYSKLCHLLVTHKRSFLLASVLKAIVEIYREDNNIEQFTITSVIPLSHNQKQVCEQFLRSACNCKVQCTYLLSSSLIAGIRMQSNHFSWERSVRKQIRMIQHLVAQ